MNFAVIAAGKGERLKNEGVETPKSLIKIHGETLLDRCLRLAVESGVSSFNIILNSWLKSTADELNHRDLPFDLNVVVEDTAGSMHSLNELKPFLQEETTVLMTVDSIFNPVEFENFLKFAQKDLTDDGLWAVTSHIDDEKPLYAGLDKKEELIREFSDEQNGHKYVTGGIYYFKKPVQDLLDSAMEKGIERMRDFQRELLKQNLKIRAYKFSEIIDIDHKEDIKKAEEIALKWER